MRNKYRAVRTVVDGVSFASKKEARRWGELLLLQKTGAISNLRRQVTYQLIVNGMLVCKYIADAVYTEKGEEVVEDTKSEITRKNPVYRLKMKLLKACHNVDIRET